MSQSLVAFIGICRRRGISPPRSIISPTVSQADMAQHVPTVHYRFLLLLIWNMSVEHQWTRVIHVPAPFMTQVPLESNV